MLAIISDNAEALLRLLAQYPHLLVDGNPFLISFYSDHWCLIREEPPHPVLITECNLTHYLTTLPRGIRLVERMTNTDSVRGLTLLQFVQHAAMRNICPRVWEVLRHLC